MDRAHFGRLSPDQWRTLTKLSLESANDPRSVRARIVLAAAEGQSGVEIARRLRVSAAMVTKWRKRFQAEGLDAMQARARPRPSRRLCQERVSMVVDFLNHGGLSTREVAARAKVSQSSVVRIGRLTKGNDSARTDPQGHPRDRRKLRRD